MDTGSPIDGLIFLILVILALGRVAYEKISYLVDKLLNFIDRRFY